MDKIKTWILIVAVLVMAGWVQAASFRPLPEQEKANLGATHVLTMTYADFTVTATNTAQTFSNVFAVAAKEGVELVAMQLTEAFDTGNTNYTGSVLVTVGDGTDADLYLTSTELASDGTEVWLKYGRSVQGATSMTLTNVVGDSTNTYTVLTALTDDSTGRKVYTAADEIEIVFTPNAEEALTDHTSGAVKFYFKWLQ